MQTTGVQFCYMMLVQCKQFGWPEKDTANESDRCVADFKCLRPKQLTNNAINKHSRCELCSFLVCKRQMNVDSFY
jgi:hypothetical protein